MSPIGGLAFTELASTDPASTQRFLEQVFGWRFRIVAMPLGEYRAYETPDGRGGIRPTRGSEPPSTLAYIRVDDLVAAERRVLDAGANLILPRVDVPGMGAFFWFQIPGGPILACWQDVPAAQTNREESRR